MKNLRESLLDDEKNIINDESIHIKIIKNYLMNPRIKLHPSIIFQLISYMGPGYVITDDNDTKDFIKSFPHEVGKFPGAEETAEWMVNTYFKYQKTSDSDSIFSGVSRYDEENGEGIKMILPKYVNKVLKNDRNALSHYETELDSPNPITEYKNNIDEFVMFDQGPNWDNYFFFWIPKNATNEEKEILHLIFEAGLRTVKR